MEFKADLKSEFWEYPHQKISKNMIASLNKRIVFQLSFSRGGLLVFEAQKLRADMFTPLKFKIDTKNNYIWKEIYVPNRYFW